VPVNILQQLEVLVLAILFSILFISMNDRKAKIKKARLNKKEEEGN
jgi:hypothetical protein